MARITSLNMTGTDILIAMADGNPGAITACMTLMEDAERVDPDSVLGAMSPIFALDTLGIYGSRIWMLYKDVCKQDTARVLALLRAHQLGQIAGVTSRALNHAIDNRGDGIDVDAALAAVKQRLPAFNAATTEADQP